MSPYIAIGPEWVNQYINTPLWNERYYLSETEHTTNEMDTNLMASKNDPEFVW